MPEIEADTAHALVEDLENVQAGRDDLGADSIPREDGDMETQISFHCCDFLVLAGTAAGACNLGRGGVGPPWGQHTYINKTGSGVKHFLPCSFPFGVTSRPQAGQ